MMKKLALSLLVAGFLGACNQQPTPKNPSVVIPQATTYKYYLPTTLNTTIYTASGNYHNTNNDPSIDFLPGAGGTTMPIAAMRGGTVTVARSNLGRCDTGNVPTLTCPGDTYYGNVVMIQHSDGTYALYAHLAQNSIPAGVVVGATVTTGQVIGQMGLTGNTSGYHLHLEVRAAGAANGVLGNYQFGAVRPSFVEAGNNEVVPGVVYTSQNTNVPPPPPTPNCNYSWNPGGGWTRQILDNDQNFTDGQGFEKLGLYPQYWWLDGGNGSGGDTIYTYSGNVPDENYGRWSTYIPRGKYDVYAYIPIASGNADNQGIGNAYADNVNYKVQSFSGTVYNTAVINQSTNRGCWVKLGSDYVWAQGERVAVQLGDNVSGAALRRVYYDDIAYYRTARPLWSLSPSGLTLPVGVVGGTTSNATFTVTNTGNLLGVGALSATNGFTTSQTSALLNPSQALNLTVTAPTCTAVGTQTSIITMTGDDTTATLAVSRVCNAAPPPIPATPTNPTLGISSDGRSLFTFAEVSNATTYSFSGTFDGTPLVFSSPVNARGSGSSGVVLAWQTTTEAADPVKSGKQLCIAIRANNASGSSTTTTPVCSTYRYYTGVSLQQVDNRPVIKISLP